MLLEAVPNVSEGRRPEVVARLAAAVGAVPGARLLDLSSDPDHNRSVLTLAGAPAALEEALLGLYSAALGEIDLASHDGVHPRVGVVDVVPFVPLAGARMENAIEAARALARRVAERFELPVFLYERAASREARRSLADLRRGGPSGLAERMAGREWAPDFGPARLDPRRGATAIGARGFLIAFNAELETRDVRIAKKIARAIRASSGGLPAVKAMGVYLSRLDRAQVSMNLVDFTRTPPLAALEAIRREAAALGTEVVATEVVGLIPEGALAGTSPEELRIKNFRPELVLENRLRALDLI